MSHEIIDMHNHLDPDESSIDRYAEAAKRLGINHIVFHGLEWPGSTFSRNSAIEKAIRERPDLFIGFGGVNLWEDVNADRIDRLKEKGFTGLKFIIPPEPYHSERFYPYYERAATLGMPVMFHLGIVSSIGTEQVRVDNNLMRPIYLDTIARDFRQLTIIGAHLGNPWYEEAAMSARWNPNLFFDLTGSTLKKKFPSFIGELLWWDETTEYGSPKWNNAWEQIIFGTDVGPDRMEGVLNDYLRLFDDLLITTELRRRVMYGTASDILCVDGNNQEN